MPGQNGAIKVTRSMDSLHPDMPSRTLARKLLREHPDKFANLEAARNSVRAVRGNCGERNRKLATRPRENGKAGWKPECPPAIVETWEPYVIDKAKRVLCLSDIHVPFHDPQALTAALQFGRSELKPDVVLLNGDIVDMYSISRHDKDPTRVGGLREEIRILREVLEWIIGAFPKARFFYKLGNHEERLNHYLWQNAPELLDVASCRLWELKAMADLPIQWIWDKRPVMAGRLPILHGHEFARGFSAPVNPARGAFLKTLHTVMIGHLHRSSTHPEPDMFGSETTCWSVGCLCGRNPQWLPINKWNAGFAFVLVKADGEFDVHNYKISRDGKVRTV